jgi:hypothetical protein
MEHRISISSNPRILIMFAVALILCIAGLVLVQFSRIPGLIIFILGTIMVTGYIRQVYPLLTTKIISSESGIVIKAHKKDDIVIKWDEILVSGYFQERGTKPSLFIVVKESKNYYLIPNEFSDFPQLQSLLREQSPYEEPELSDGDSIVDWFETRLGGKS